jgi:hypothetical protein
MVTVPVLIWAGTDEWRAEAAHVRPVEGRFTAAGVQLGVGPEPYRVDYILDTTVAWMTRRLQVTAAGDDWRRSLLLTRDSSGRWTCRTDAAGQVDLPMPGGEPSALADAVDCDLGLSPLTNTMPILRHRLHQRAGKAECAMAWVSVPDLSVHASTQRYEHLETTPTGAVVRFTSGDFTADLVVDTEGFVVDYPQLARRIGGPNESLVDSSRN